MPTSERATTPTQHTVWNDLVGAAWVRHSDVHDGLAGPFGTAAMDAIGPLSGARVLDVGCGMGATAADLLGRGAGTVVGVDLSAPMINAARARNQTTGICFELSDVLALQPVERFDLVFSRFGVMFFTDPVAGFKHLRALGAAQARLGFCCWGPPAENPWMTLPVMATVPVLGSPRLAGPGEPGPFSLSSPEVVRDVLGAAGWQAVTVRKLTIDQPHPAGAADAVAAFVIEFNPPIVAGLRHAPEKAGDVRRAISEALRPCERDGVVHLQASALIVTAQG